TRAPTVTGAPGARGFRISVVPRHGEVAVYGDLSGLAGRQLVTVVIDNGKVAHLGGPAHGQQAWVRDGTPVFIEVFGCAHPGHQHGRLGLSESGLEDRPEDAQSLLDPCRRRRTAAVDDCAE